MGRSICNIIAMIGALIVIELLCRWIFGFSLALETWKWLKYIWNEIVASVETISN